MEEIASDSIVRAQRHHAGRTAVFIVAAIVIVAALVWGIRAVGRTTGFCCRAPETAQELAIRYDGVAGVDALTLLKRGHRVEAKDFGPGLGEFVEGIDGNRAVSGSSFWSFRVNGEPATIGAAQYLTKDGDRIEWRIERITP